MPTSTRRECCVPVVERARSFLRLVCDAPGPGTARQRTEPALRSPPRSGDDLRSARRGASVPSSRNAKRYAAEKADG